MILSVWEIKVLLASRLCVCSSPAAQPRHALLLHTRPTTFHSTTTAANKQIQALKYTSYKIHIYWFRIIYQTTESIGPDERHVF